MHPSPLASLAPIALAGALATSAQGGTQALSYQRQQLEVEGAVREVQVPAGYTLDLLASGLGGPRLLAFADNGDLFAGSRSGKVYRIPPPYMRPEVLVELPDYPHSVAFRPGEILIAQTNGLYRAAYQPGQRRLAAAEVSRLAPLPGGGGHNSRTVTVGPDGRIYLSLGISGNCSDQYLDPSYPVQDRRGGVMVLDETRDPPAWRPYGSGLRNPVGLAWQPGTGTLYASNNGPDHWGFELPPEYFSRIDAGSFHGMPWFQYDGQRLRRDDCLSAPAPRPLAEVTAPVATFPARNAPMGVAFVPPGALDPNLAGDAVVALHGSWATRPAGAYFGSAASRRPPKLVLVRFRDGAAADVVDLITGFQLPDGQRWARPVGVAIGPDGALYFSSDDGANAIFRLRRAR